MKRTFILHTLATPSCSTERILLPFGDHLHSFVAALLSP